MRIKRTSGISDKKIPSYENRIIYVTADAHETGDTSDK